MFIVIIKILWTLLSIIKYLSIITFHLLTAGTRNTKEVTMDFLVSFMDTWNIDKRELNNHKIKH